MKLSYSYDLSCGFDIELKLTKINLIYNYFNIKKDIILIFFSHTILLRVI
jgi:hypothetical protein